MAIGLTLFSVFAFLHLLFKKSCFSLIYRYRFWLVVNLVFYPLVFDFIYRKSSYFMTDILRTSHLLDISAWPTLVQFLFLLVLVDFLKFTSHWAFHAVPFLWSFHMVHHAQDEIEFVSAFKHSWIEGFSQIPILLAVSFFINTHPTLLISINFIFFALCVWQHSRLFERFSLNGVIVIPFLHRLHNRLVGDIEYHGNYGLLFSGWDRLFKTYIDVIPNKNLNFGVTETNYPNNDFKSEFFFPLTQTKRINIKI